MALEYKLDLATPLEPPQLVAKLMAPPFGFEMRYGRLIAPGVVVLAASETDLGRSLVRDAYHIEPTAYIKFRLDKFEEWEAGLHKTIRTSIDLMGIANCDGVLLFNGETVILMRIGGRLILNENHDFWSDASRLSDVIEPHSMQSIPSL